MRTHARSALRHGWSTWLVYASLGFVLLWLARSGDLVMPTIRDHSALGLSLAFLVAGFVCSAAAWRQLLSVHGLRLGWQPMLAAVGLTVFGKYIPGKLWGLVGRAGFAARVTGYPVGHLSALSVTAQLLMIWLGLGLGSLVFLILPRLGHAEVGVLLLSGCAFVAVTAVLMSDLPRRLLDWLSARWHRRLPRLPHQDWRSLLKALPLFLFTWICWVFGFSLFVTSLTDGGIIIAHGLAFALATTLGILAFLVPGGLGVREGLLVIFLAAFGMPAAVATGVAVHARVWFFLGETSIFLLGLIASRGTKAQQRQKPMRTDE